MATRRIKNSMEDEGGGASSGSGQTSILLNRSISEVDGQAVAIFAKHLDQQQLEKHRERRSSLPNDGIELTTLTSGVVTRRKQQLQSRYQQKQSNTMCNPKQHQNHLIPAATATSTPPPQPTTTMIAATSITTITTKTGRPLSISSISSAASSGSSSSANSSSSSGIQSSLTRNGSLNYGHEYRKLAYLASVESLNQPSQSQTPIIQRSSGTSGGNYSDVQTAFKQLSLSCQSKDSATRAAVLAAGESQRRGFGAGKMTSRINRSLHASLRYDKNTARRIQFMANARDSMAVQPICQNEGMISNDSNDECRARCGSSISRNNSSTSSDSGHPRQDQADSSRFACPCELRLASSKTTSSSASRVDDSNSRDCQTDPQLIAGSFSNKAATLDGAQCQRSTTKHYPGCSYFIQPRRQSAKLQPSPSSASSHSHSSSLFRDDGFEDDLTSTASEHASTSAHNHRHRLSYPCQGSHYGCRGQHELLRRHGEEEDDYQSCEEEFSNSQTTASTTSNLDDCALSTTSSSIIIQHEQQVFDKISLANAKQQYRKSLLLEHNQQQHHLNALHANNQNKIQALLQQPPKLGALHLPPTAGNQSANTSTISSNSSSCASPTRPSKCDDRTVNIIGHMPTKSPGYWDSNLSITQRVVTEIIETERTYVDDLEQIVTGYICYLRNVLKQQKHQKQQQALIQNNLMNTQFKKQTTQGVPTTDSACQGVTGSSSVTEEDDKSNMVLEDDELTCAANEVDDDDVEDQDQDVALKDSHSQHGMMQNQLGKGLPLNEASGTIVSSIDIKRLFNNLEEIYKFNKDLLFRLEECYLNPSSVAECFVENASGFEVYTHYCTMYPQVVSTLTELMANPSSAQLLKERQNELNQGLPLGAYLLKPVQRILKYHILFQSLIKHTADDETVNEKDRQLINEAFSVMTSIACHINAMKKRHEHSIRVQEVQGLLSGWEGPDLTTLGELILEDTFRLCNRQKSNRHLFLFDNVLLITKKKHDGCLFYKGHIECSNLMLIENIERQPLVFNTVPFDNPKALCAFQAKNLDKKRDWCLQMKEVIIKSFEVKIPVHVRDLLMSLTTSSSSAGTDNASSSKSPSSSDTARALRAPNYLEKKRARNDKKSK